MYITRRVFLPPLSLLVWKTARKQEVSSQTTSSFAMPFLSTCLRSRDSDWPLMSWFFGFSKKKGKEASNVSSVSW
jgi:hypothetical protein